MVAFLIALKVTLFSKIFGAMQGQRRTFGFTSKASQQD